MVTLSDVAALAGVSVSAVSRVLSGSPSARVGDDTRQRIRAAAETLGYRPNFAGRALRSARTDVVALVVPDLTNAIFTELLRGVEDDARERGYVVLLARAEAVRSGEESVARLIGEGRVDGVILHPGDDARAPDLIALATPDLPVVLVNAEGAEGVDSVVLDDARGMTVAVEHLVARGHRRIALAGGLSSSQTAARREQGFRAAMAAAGLPVDESTVMRLGYTPGDGVEAAAILAERANRPTAVAVANVNAAYGLLRALRAHDVRVPDDLSVIALHDTWTADHVWPALTTVRMPLYDLGRAAMSAVVERAVTGRGVRRVVAGVEPVVVRRDSVATMASK